MIPAYEPLLLSYGTASEKLRVAATILWRSAADAVSYGPDEDGLASRRRPARGRVLEPGPESRQVTRSLTGLNILQ